MPLFQYINVLNTVTSTKLIHHFILGCQHTPWYIAVPQLMKIPCFFFPALSHFPTVLHVFAEITPKFLFQNLLLGEPGVSLGLHVMPGM